jgi:protein SCO1/2
MTAANNSRKVKITLFVLIVVMSMLVGGFVHRMMKPTIFNEHQMQNYGAVMFDKPRIFREFSLLDHDGKPFTAERLKGKWTLLFFGFTYCPDICPTTLGTLNKLYAELETKGKAADIQIVLVSVDPARDTSEKLRDYVHYFNPAFIGVRGEFMDTQKFAADLNAGFTKVPGMGDNYLIEHSGNIVVINPYGHYHGFFKPPFDPVRLRLAFDSVRAQFQRDFGRTAP